MTIKKFIKKRNNRLMAVIFIIGIAILVVSCLLPDGKDGGGAAQYAGEEERLSEILSEIEGAGRISVMITYESAAERSFSASARDAYPKVRGVIVVADGAADPVVRQELAAAAIAVTGAGANRVCIYKRGSD